MLDFIFNPIVLLLATTVIMTSLMFLFVGRKKKQKKVKVEKVYKKEEKIEQQEEIKSDKLDEKLKDDEDKKEEKTQKDDDLIEKRDELFEEVEENNNDLKNKDKKITKVYIRRQGENTNQNEIQNSEDLKYEELSKRAEFVKTSKSISKLSKFKTDEDILEEITEEKIEEPCEICDTIKSRIDHSRRLSKIIKDDDFNNLFASHITEKYLNIDSGKHVHADLEIAMFERANKMIENGENRALDPEEQREYNNLKNDKDKLVAWMAQQRVNVQSQFFEEPISVSAVHFSKDFELSLKNLIYTDALMKRKKFKK